MGDVRFGITRAELETILSKPERTMGGANEYLSRGIAVVVGKNSVNVILFGDRNDPGSPLVGACRFMTDKGIGKVKSVCPVYPGNMIHSHDNMTDHS